MPLVPVLERLELCNWKDSAKVTLGPQMRNVLVTKGVCAADSERWKKNFARQEASAAAQPQCTEGPETASEADSNAAERS